MNIINEKMNFETKSIKETDQIFPQIFQIEAEALRRTIKRRLKLFFYDSCLNDSACKKKIIMTKSVDQTSLL